MDNKKVRNSNIELLRIIAMFVIVAYHISVHCVRFQLIDKESINVLENFYFCHPKFYRRLFLIEGMMPLGIMANDIFVLISGYFLVEKGKKFNLGNISKKLLLQVGFVATLLTLSSAAYCLIKHEVIASYVSLRTIVDINYMSWFVGYYFAIIIIAFVFLNGFLEKIDKKGYGTLLITLLALFSLSWSGTLMDNLAGGIRTLLCGVFLYALGGYIKRYNPFRNIRAWALVGTVIIIYGLLFVSYYNTVENSMHSYAMSNSTDIFIQPLFIFDNYSFVAVILAIVVFELFSRIKIRNSKLINGLAGATFIIYLLHDNDFFRGILRKVNWMELLSENMLMYVIKLLELSGVVFILGLIAYGIYVGLGKVCVLCKRLVVKKE